jgi:hypothetical protein
VDRAHDPQPGLGIDNPPARPPQKAHKRFLTPFICPNLEKVFNIWKRFWEFMAFWFLIVSDSAWQSDGAKG